MMNDAIGPENIRALGAVYFAAMLEELQAFDVADRLLELYLIGRLPVRRSGAGEALHRYWKDASARMSSTERRDLYARVLGPAGSETAAVAARTLRQQVDDLIKALGDAEIQRAYGARDMWQLIERVSSLELRVLCDDQTPSVRDAIRTLLATSPAFARLSPVMQSRVARDTASIADYLVKVDAAGPFGALLSEIDFPAFVAGLVKGVFHAIVDVSIRQMEAYADLVAAVAASLQEFRDENISDIQARERLCERFPPLCEPAHSQGDGPHPAGDAVIVSIWRRVATTRQQLLATMVMMGINRLVASKS